MTVDKFISPAKRVEYPLIIRTPSRVQVIFHEPPAQQYGILLLHSSSMWWNAYTLVDSVYANVLAKDAYALTVLSYLAPAGRPVTWMGPTLTGKLSIPVQLLPSEDGGDYWAGTKLDGYPADIDSMIDQLFIFHNDIFDLCDK